MRLVVAGVFLPFVLAGGVAAHANTIDNFVLTGNGQTETWSLPSPDPYAIQPYMAVIYFSTTVTTDGVPSVEDVEFYSPGGVSGASLNNLWTAGHLVRGGRSRVRRRGLRDGYVRSDGIQHRAGCAGAADQLYADDHAGSGCDSGTGCF